MSPADYKDKVREAERHPVQYTSTESVRGPSNVQPFNQSWTSESSEAKGDPSVAGGREEVARIMIRPCREVGRLERGVGRSGRAKRGAPAPNLICAFHFFYLAVSSSSFSGL